MLSLGGIRQNIAVRYQWSDWMDIICEDEASEDVGDDDENEAGEDEEEVRRQKRPLDLTWSLYLKSVSIHKRNSLDAVVDTLALKPPSDAENEHRTLHFDTGMCLLSLSIRTMFMQNLGCSHSHYNDEILAFFEKHELIIPMGQGFWCNTQQAKCHVIVFHLRSGYDRKTAYQLHLPAKMLGESKPAGDINGLSVTKATIASSGVNQAVNVWGNVRLSLISQ